MSTIVRGPNGPNPSNDTTYALLFLAYSQYMSARENGPTITSGAQFIAEIPVPILAGSSVQASYPPNSSWIYGTNRSITLSGSYLGKTNRALAIPRAFLPSDGTGTPASLLIQDPRSAFPLYLIPPGELTTYGHDASNTNIAINMGWTLGQFEFLQVARNGDSGLYVIRETTTNRYVVPITATAGRPPTVGLGPVGTVPTEYIQIVRK